MARIIDNAIAIRVAYLLSIPLTSWPAFKDGTINEDGIVIKKPKTDEELGNWTALHRLIARLKRAINVIPGGRTLLGGLAASYLLMRESTDDLNNLMNKLREMCPEIMEEIAVSAVSNVPSTQDPNVKTKKQALTYKQRNELGCDINGELIRRKTFKEWVAENFDMAKVKPGEMNSAYGGTSKKVTGSARKLSNTSDDNTYSGASLKTLAVVQGKNGQLRANGDPLNVAVRRMFKDNSVEAEVMAKNNRLSTAPGKAEKRVK